jgi:hypothetical protein
VRDYTAAHIAIEYAGIEHEQANESCHAQLSRFQYDIEIVHIPKQDFLLHIWREAHPRTSFVENEI